MGRSIFWYKDISYDDFSILENGTKPRSFSLAGVMDTKLRHSLPDHSRRLTTLLMFNGDIEGCFA